MKSKMVVRKIGDHFGIAIRNKWFTYKYGDERTAQFVLAKLEKRRSPEMLAVNFTEHAPLLTGRKLD